MVDVHPDDGELIDMILGAADSSVREHVRGCTTCIPRMHQWSAIRNAAVAATPPPVPFPRR